MKYLSILLLTVLLFFGTASAQVEPQAIVKNNIERLLRYAKQNNAILASRLIAYKGSDSERNLKDAINTENGDELKQSKRIIKKLTAFLNLSDNYEFGEFQKQSDDSGEIYKQEIKFVNDAQSLSTYFTFVNFEGRYLLIEFE